MQLVKTVSRWRFGAPVALTVGTGWEGWHRNSAREVPVSDEFFAKATLDVTPADWLLTRLTYRPSIRSGKTTTPRGDPPGSFGTRGRSSISTSGMRSLRRTDQTAGEPSVL